MTKTVLLARLAAVLCTSSAVLIFSGTTVDASGHSTGITEPTRRFTARRGFSSAPPRLPTKRRRPLWQKEEKKNAALLHASRVSAPVIRLAAAVLLAASAFVVQQFRILPRLLWPNARPDPAISEPLPPGSLGCPWLGSNILKGSQRKGPEYFYREASHKVGDPSVWKFYFLGRPVASVSGIKLLKKINNMEFTNATEAADTDLQPFENEKESAAKKKKDDRPRIFGSNNVMFERNKERHDFLRRLVGSAMTPQALKEALPTIQKTAQATIESEILNGQKVVKMENVCVDFTMAIVQNQFLGIQLSTEEACVFRDKVKVWLKALYSLSAFVPWLVRRSASYKAKLYIVEKIEQKIDLLLEKGPDSSTLSNMLFAVDENDPAKKLSREEVIENAQVLVIAGSETTASTLTLATLLLGLHPDKHQTIVKEQQAIVQRYGKELTPRILDQEMPYLEAAIKEALRLGTVTGNFPKTAKQTITVDGFQIPKGWNIFSNYRLTHQLDPVIREANNAHMDPWTGFVPERWFQEATTPSAFVPFGTGPRFCLGYNLAMLEMNVFLATMARNLPVIELVNNQQGGVRWNPSTLIPMPVDGTLIKAPEATTISTPSGTAHE